MPTEEERKRQYRNGYSPSGQYAARPGSVWDSVRSEMNALSRSAFSGNPEGRRIYEEGRDAIAGTFRREGERLAESPPGRLVGGVVREIPGALRQIGSTYNTALGTLADMHSDQDTRTNDVRSRRLEQAGVASVPNGLQASHGRTAASTAPVMSKTQETGQRPELGLRGEVPQEAGLGNVSPRPPLSESSKSSSSAAVGTAGAGRGGVGPTISASDQEYLNRQPVTADPRKRYFDMAQMSLEQREQFLNSLPEGQRPIQTIRGNKEAWYSPGMSREFGTIPEAMSGVEGRPTLKSEMGREEEARDRAAMVDIAGSRNRTTLAAEGMRQAGQDRRLLKEHELGLKNGKGTAKGSDGEKWKVEKVTLPDGTEAIHQYDEGSGKHITIKPGDTNAIAGALAGYNMEDSKTRQLALDMLNGVGDMAAIESIYKNQPGHVQKAILQAIKERKESEKKK